jgi:hypothetical protein
MEQLKILGALLKKMYTIKFLKKNRFVISTLMFISLFNLSRVIILLFNLFIILNFISNI